MIIFIIFVVATIIGGVLFVYSQMNWDREISLVLGITLLLLGGLGSVTTGCIALINNSMPNCQQVLIRYEQKKTELEATKQLIEYITDDYARSVAVQKYNAEVTECRIEILAEQKMLRNYFINWYHCKAYNQINVDDYQFIASFK